MSSLFALCVITFLLHPGPANAHEIRPAIADVTVSADRLDLDISLAIEALIAGMDLEGLEDTNASPLSAQYDSLRQLAPAPLEAAFRNAWPQVSSGFTLMAGEQPITLSINGMDIPETGDPELARISTLHLSAPLPLDDSAVTVRWLASYGPLVVRQIVEGEGGYTGYLTGGETSASIPRSGSAQQPWFTAFRDYIGIGFVHIVPRGLDHILFVLGLFFFSLKLHPLLMQVTSFTVAHTVALALAVLGYVQIPPAVVEPLIAASIVYVAIENTRATRLRAQRTAVVFAFGLLHGLGFAAVLGDIGLDPARFITGLIGFNIGVELGQLAVISAAFLAVGLWFGRKPWYRDVIAIPASIGIAIIGAYWFIQRVFF